VVIANPLFDIVFKKLMENDRVAKFFIGTLLDETIETVEVKPQEFTYSNDLLALAVFRLDFIATIKTNTGQSKKVLIEIQKAKNLYDLMRFRNYLGEQYKKEDLVNGEKVALPITTIYILGFKLPEIETPCIKIERNYKDLIEKKLIQAKCEFVEKLTHDSYIVQVDRITDRYQTSLDKLLSIFEQRNFIDDKKIIKQFHHTADTEEMKIATDILHYTGTEPEEKLQIEIEQEAWRTVDALSGGFKEKAEKYMVEAKKQKEEAEKQRIEAEKQKIEAEKQRIEAEKQKIEAEKQTKEAEKQKIEAEKQTKEAEKQKIEAEKQTKEAEKQKIEAEKQTKEAEKQKIEAEKQTKEAEKQKIEAGVLGLKIIEKEKVLDEKERIIDELKRRLGE